MAEMSNLIAATAVVTPPAGCEEPFDDQLIKMHKHTLLPHNL